MLALAPLHDDREADPDSPSLDTPAVVTPAVDGRARLAALHQRLAKAISPAWRTVAFLLGVTVFRLWIAAAVPLTEDEAYYRLWAQHPALGYFDHPPMIAWWIWCGVRLLGDNALGVRLLPVLAASLTSAMAARIVWRLTRDSALAARAPLWHQSALLVGLGGMLATPDAPMTLLWTAGVLLALEARAGAPNLWIAVGLATGLALLSKYSALFLPAGLLLWLASDPAGRAELRRVQPWLGAALAAALLGLNIAWNAQHGWVTFEKQFGRVAVGGLQARHVFEFLTVQALLLNPLLTALVVRALVRLWRTRGAPDPASLAPVLIAAPFVAYLIFHSLHAPVQGHWPAPLYPLAVVLAVIESAVPGGSFKRGLVRTVPLGLGLSALLLVQLASPRHDHLGLTPWTLPLRGWSRFAGELETRRREVGAGWVGVFSYGMVAQLRATDGIKAPVIQLTERRRYPDHEVDPLLLADRPGLIVDLQRRLNLGDLRGCFQDVTRLPAIDRGDENGPWTQYAVIEVGRPRRDIASQGCWAGKTPDKPSSFAKASKH